MKKIIITTLLTALLLLCSSCMETKIGSDELPIGGDFNYTIHSSVALNVTMGDYHYWDGAGSYSTTDINDTPAHIGYVVLTESCIKSIYVYSNLSTAGTGFLEISLNYQNDLLSSVHSLATGVQSISYSPFYRVYAGDRIIPRIYDTTNAVVGPMDIDISIGPCN